MQHYKVKRKANVKPRSHRFSSLAKRRIMKIAWILLLAMVVYSCRNKSESEEKNETTKIDSTSTMQKVLEADTLALNAEGVKEWIQQTLKDSAVSTKMSLEEYWKEDSLVVTPFEGGQTFFNDYKSVLRWSPDSTYVIDIGSYGSVLTKDNRGKPIVEAGEPDSELALIEPRKQQRTRLMFVGPSSNILGARWIDNEQAMVVGTFDRTGNNNYDTLVWMIDVSDKIFRLYNVKSHR